MTFPFKKNPTQIKKLTHPNQINPKLNSNLLIAKLSVTLTEPPCLCFLSLQSMYLCDKELCKLNKWNEVSDPRGWDDHHIEFGHGVSVLFWVFFCFIWLYQLQEWLMAIMMVTLLILSLFVPQKKKNVFLIWLNNWWYLLLSMNV
jgi:hypothetical protein